TPLRLRSHRTPKFCCARGGLVLEVLQPRCISIVGAASRCGTGLGKGCIAGRAKAQLQLTVNMHPGRFPEPFRASRLYRQPGGASGQNRPKQATALAREGAGHSIKERMGGGSV